MSLLIDTVNDLKAQHGYGIDVNALRSLALETAFDLLDKESQVEVCEAVKEAQESISIESQKSSAISRENYRRIERGESAIPISAWSGLKFNTDELGEMEVVL